MRTREESLVFLRFRRGRRAQGFRYLRGLEVVRQGATLRLTIHLRAHRIQAAIDATNARRFGVIR